MNKQIRQRTWKYFWEQKGKEISDVLLFLFIIVSILGLIAQLGWIPDRAWEKDCGIGGYPSCKEVYPIYETSLPYWMMYTGFITTGIWIIIGLIYWIQTNWKEAKRKAKKDFK